MLLEATHTYPSFHGLQSLINIIIDQIKFGCMSISRSQISISKSMCDYIKIVKFKKNVGTNVRYKYIKIKKMVVIY